MRILSPAWRSSLPDRRAVLLGAPIWAVLMAASAYSAPLLRGWETQPNFMRVVMLFGLGGLLAFPLGVILAGWLSSGKALEARIAAALLGFGVGTVAVTALLYVLDYHDYYSEWHEPPFTKHWLVELVITAAVALYQFAAIGMRLYFPLGFCALFGVAAWFARLPH